MAKVKVEKEGQAYEVNFKDKLVTYQPRSKEARIREFKQFLESKFSKRWMEQPHKVTVLEKQYLKEFFDSL